MNRHADALSDFTECVQAALNRNGHKPGLDTMWGSEIINKTYEECEEMQADMWRLMWRREHDLRINPEKLEREAADLAVCALAAWMWARGLGGQK